MRIAALLFISFLSSIAWADDQLWKKLKTEPNLVVLMRHAHSAGGNPLTWDQSGNCKGESVLSPRGKAHARKVAEAFASRGIKPAVISSPMCRCLETVQLVFGVKPITDPALRETASADIQQTEAFETKARSLIASKRGTAPVVFVSHRPNIDRLTMELLDEDDLLVGRTDENGEIEVLGKLTLGQ